MEVQPRHKLIGKGYDLSFLDQIEETKNETETEDKPNIEIENAPLDFEAFKQQLFKPKPVVYSVKKTFN